MTGPRIGRTLIVAAVTFVLCGGVFGFASAANEQARADGSIYVPMPGPGATAQYAVTEVFPDGPPAFDYPPVTALTLRWQEPSILPDGDYGVRAVFALDMHITRDGADVDSKAIYDAETGRAFASGWGYERPSQGYDGCVTWCELTDAPPGPGNIDVTFYDDDAGFCGALTPFHGALLSPGDEHVLGGNCDARQGNPTVRFEAETTPTGLRMVGDVPEVFLDYEDGNPFPVAGQMALTRNFGGSYESDRRWEIRLVSSTPTAAFDAVVDGAVAAPLGPVALASRQPWGLDDEAMDHPFPLRTAHAAALDWDPLSAWLDDHPGAYLGEAWGRVEVDEFEEESQIWSMTYTDGAEHYPLTTRSDPMRVMGVNVPDGPRQISVAYRPGSSAEAGDHRFPAPAALPDRLPDPAGVLARYDLYVDASARPEVSDRYGFGYYCDEAACSDPAVVVVAGYQVLDVDRVGHSDLVEDDRIEIWGQLNVRGDGTPRSTETGEQYQQAFIDQKLASAVIEPAGPEPEPAEPGTWTLPPAPFVAAAGIMTVLVAALYHFAPAIKGIIPGFTRIREDKVLDQPTRRAIHDAIIAEPGIHFTELLRRLDIGRSTLDHHAKLLEGAGLVLSRRQNGYRCFTPASGIDRRAAEALPLVRAAGARAILELVHKHPGVSGREVARRAGMSVSTVSYHVNRLVEGGVLRREGGLWATSTGQQVL